MAVTIQTRRDDALDWTTANPVLALGEIGIETDTDKAKYGDGFTAWNDLEYWIGTDPIPTGTDTQTIKNVNGVWEATSDVVVDGSGNVGIGIAVPSQNLEVRSLDGTGTNIGITSLTGQTSSLRLTSDTQSRVQFSDGVTNNLGRIQYLFSDQSMVFQTNNAESMRITSTGQVGIGTTAPTDYGANTTTLTIGATVPILQFKEGSTNTNRLVSSSGSLVFYQNAADERMRIDASGNLLVGGSAWGGSGAAGKLTIMGDNSRDAARIYRATATASPYILACFSDVGGTYSFVGGAQGDGTWTGPVSDATLKENIQDSALGLPEILQIPVRAFDWKSGGSVSAGFVAQELEQILPQAVVTAEDGLKGRSDAHLVPVLVKAIQEQQAQIDELRTLIEGAP